MRRRFLTAAALPAVAAALLGASIAAAQDAPEGDRLVPAWIRTVAAAWSGGDISDAEFVAAMGFLINEGIIPASEQHEQDDDLPESLVYDHEHALRNIQDNVSYGENYEHYAHHIDYIADIAVPDDEDKCFDRFGNVRTPSIKLKFKNNEYIRTFIDVTGAGIKVDPENKRPLWYQIFNNTHSVSPVYYIRAFETGLQIGDTIWMYHMQIGETYEIRSVYGNQCGRSEMILGY
ncbi:MAG: hypothetical protein EB832_02640 [Thaumarchaeota archaeon S14]|nr:MAG: hypothetical protein EB832_02640 [Thaumarchaeota archaeon S14]